MPDELFSDDFCRALRELITAHHGIYPRLPPRDIFFEDLVARAFRRTGQPEITLSTPGRSREDMTVGNTRLSIKTETGYGTKRDLITITKLSTTEKTAWISAALIDRILRHLAEYETMLMLRAIWQAPPAFHYQLLEIPKALLSLIAGVTVEPVGRRTDKKSLKAAVMLEGQQVFEVVFDATDGKCMIRNLLVSRCTMLAEWDHEVPPEWQGNWPIHISPTSGRQSRKRAAASHDERPSTGGQQSDPFES